LQQASILRKHVFHLPTVINLPNTNEIVAILPYFGCSLGDTGDIAALQAVDKVARGAPPTDERGEPAFPAMVAA
jgi:hypothetical protein